MSQSKTYFFVLTFFLINAVNGQNYKLVDSIKTVLSKSTNDSLRIILYLKWDNEIYLADPKTDEYLNKEVIRICKKNLKVKNLSKRNSDFFNKNLATSYNNIGLYYSDRGAYDISLDNYNKALIIRENINDERGVATVLNNIGLIYKDLQRPEDAIRFYKLSIKIMRKIGDAQSESTCLNNIGIVYQDKQLYDSAINYYNMSLEISNKTKNISGQARTLNNLALIDLSLNKHDEALIKAQKSYDLRVQALDLLGQTMSLTTISDIYYDQKDYNNAEVYGLKAVKIGQEINAPFETMTIAFQMYKTYKNMGQFERALEMYELFREMDNKVASDKNNRALMAQQVQYEYEKKAAADSIAFAQKKAIDDARFQEEKTKKRFLYFGIGLLILFVLFVLNRLRVTRKQKRIIEDQKQIVEAKQKEIIDSINYAKRIQTALMPGDKYLEKNLSGKRVKPKSDSK